jgi:Uncharacterized protein conserved in bacteria (DUF2252)
VDIKNATQRYENRLRASLPLVVEADLDFKHTQMALAAFPFLRATFYRWAERWPQVCPHLAGGPVILGVGDLHVENFGTWRDAEGRLIWGINDFDEATYLPYTVDLVRLAASAGLATNEHHLTARLTESADALLAGYAEALSGRGEPFVLAEHHTQLRRMATSELRDPVAFWAKLHALPGVAPDSYPNDAVDALRAALPDGNQVPSGNIKARRAGLGSLGRPRLVAVAPWKGGKVAREVKAVLPSAWDWVHETPDPAVHYDAIAGGDRRCADPYSAVRGRWLIRRLAPDCARIPLTDLPAERDEAALLRDMGTEVANIHLATPGAGPEILADLGVRPTGWLSSAAAKMVADTEADWAAWRR